MQTTLMQPPLNKKDKAAFLDLLDEKIKRLELKAAKNSLLEFAKLVYPNYTVGAHHKVMARVFKDVLEGRKKRVIINIPPRHGKSELTSFLFPAWFLGHRPEAQLIMATHTASLSEDFGRRVRNLLEIPDYQSIFPDTTLAQDSKGAGSWNTNKNGKYYAVGVGGALAGRGANLLLIDDPHSEQDLKSGSKLPFEQAWNWYQTGPRQRLMWDGAIIIVMTRWGQLDLTAKLIDYQTRNPDADQWEVIEFPAILPSGSPLWPEKWPLDKLEQTRASLDPRFWNAQYQQQPTAEEAAIVKREMWRMWPQDQPPMCQFILQSWDTAYETKTSSDYSACTTWGVWYNEEEKNQPQLILLDAFRDRMEFPDLKQVALDYYREWQPDAIIIEKKAAGAPLIQELRMAGIPVQEYSPSRGVKGKSNDKVVRMNAISDIFASGRVWAPDTRWAREVIEEVAAFPVGEHDDYVDTVSQALLRFRQGGFVGTDLDEPDEPKMFRSRRYAAYY
jgi:predicted phage terminase large subunit-like protein